MDLAPYGIVFFEKYEPYVGIDRNKKKKKPLPGKSGGYPWGEEVLTSMPCTARTCFPNSLVRSVRLEKQCFEGFSKMA